MNLITHHTTTISCRKGDDEKELHKEVSDNVQDRLTKAMDELKEKHATGTNEKDDIDRAPTGGAYRELHQRQQRQAREMAKQNEERDAREQMEDNQNIMDVKERMRRMKFQDSEKENADNMDGDGNSNNSDSEDEFDHLLDEEDPELVLMRQARIAQLRQAQTERAQNMSLGHGQYRTITQDEFLPECTGSSKFVAVHFFHDDFERCKIMDFHLKIIVEQHFECKFLRIDAAKAPFFVAKLKIRTLPSLIVFEQGKDIGRLTGFEGLALNAKKPDEWHTGRLQEWLAGTGAIDYMRPSEEVDEERRRLGLVMRGAVWSDREKSGFGEEY